MGCEVVEEDMSYLREFCMERLHYLLLELSLEKWQSSRTWQWDSDSRKICNVKLFSKWLPFVTGSIKVYHRRYQYAIFVTAFNYLSTMKIHNFFQAFIMGAKGMSRRFGDEVLVVSEGIEIQWIALRCCLVGCWVVSVCFCFKAFLSWELVATSEQEVFILLINRGHLLFRFLRNCYLTANESIG